MLPLRALIPALIDMAKLNIAGGKTITIAIVCHPSCGDKNTLDMSPNVTFPSVDLNKLGSDDTPGQNQLPVAADAHMATSSKWSMQTVHPYTAYSLPLPAADRLVTDGRVALRN